MLLGGLYPGTNAAQGEKTYQQNQLQVLLWLTKLCWPYSQPVALLWGCLSSSNCRCTLGMVMESYFQVKYVCYQHTLFPEDRIPYQLYA